MSIGRQEAVYNGVKEKKMDMHSEEYLHVLMTKQLKISMKLFSIFAFIVIGMPLANYYLPEIMNARIFGFTLSWLLLGVLFYPLTWLISYIYVKQSIAFEEEAATWVDPLEH